MKKIVLLLLFTSVIYPSFANSPKANLEWYGFVRNDFYYNSRQCEEGIDGVFHFFPKPKNLVAGIDENAVSQANMLSIASRLGLNIKGQPILGAESSGKIECDFAGYGVANYVIRIRHAYMQLKWQESVLQVGQNWHPMFGSVIPVTISLNAGMPFQPFNRSPQVRFTYNLSNKFSLTGAAVYQMQYTSSGPKGFSPNYLRNSLMPELFLGVDQKNNLWTNGLGVDFKMIKPDINNRLSSLSAYAYSQFAKDKFMAKGRVTIGQNMSDLLLANGYGKVLNASTNEFFYTNLKVVSSWLNFVYGKKYQISVFGGYSHNLGSSINLYKEPITNKISVYSRGFYTDSQEMINRMGRLSASFIYNLPNLTFGLEYNLTGVEYGKIKVDGTTGNNYLIYNHRILGSVSYHF
ncbi:hypothetical protein MASR2M117_05450 [Paludibacter sp.]